MNYFVCIFFCLELLFTVTKAQQRPRILEHPTDAVAAKEEPLTLNCKATGRPQPEIVWYHNSALLIPDERKVILPEGSLFFLRVMQNKREQDAGVYWCEARSTAGTVQSRNATLQIAMLRDEFRTIPPKNIVAIVGGPVVLPCSPPRGIPEPSVLWSKDGKSLELGGKRLSLVDSGSLMISEVLSSDAGTYECSAQSMAGRRSAPVTTLKVLAPPTVVRGPHDTEVIEGEGLDLPCELAGDPIPTVSWYRETGNLPEGRSRVLLDNTLRIEDTRPEDQGQYICKGQNEGGNVSITVTLHVYAVPNFIEAPVNVNTQEGETIKLPCKAQGRPHVRIVWDRVVQSKKTEEPKISFSTSPGGQRTKRSTYTHVMTNIPPRLVAVQSESEALHKMTAQEYFPEKLSDEQLQLDEFQKIMRDDSTTKRNHRRKRAAAAGAASATDAEQVTSTQPTISNYLEVNDQGELILRDVTRNDQGWYACAAINEAGSVVKRVFVRVAQKNNDNMDQIEQVLASPEPIGSHWGSEINVMITAVVTTSSTTLDVYWEISEGLSEGPLTVYYRPTVVQAKNTIDASPRGAFKSQQTTLMTKEHSLNDLKPYTEYEVFVTVPKGLGRLVSNIRKRRTMPSAPSAPPTDIKVGIINTTAAFVRWSPPPSHLLNGELTGYKIQIKSNATNKLLGQMSLNATTQSVVINSLSPGGRYVARVAGATAAGYGPFSGPAALHMDPSFIIRPPKTDPTSGMWLSGWVAFAILGSLGIIILSGVILAIIWARKNKRNMKAAYPGPMTGTMIPDKHNTMWLHGNSLVKPAHSLAQISEYAELTNHTAANHNGSAKILNNVHPEPYATVTLQRGGGISDDSCVKCSASPSSSEYNAPLREPVNFLSIKGNEKLCLTDILPPPPDHPYGTYQRPINTTNMTIRSNPLNPNPISPQVGRRGPHDRWGTSVPHHPPPIPNFPHNWMQQQRLNAGLDLNPQEVYSENDYESGSVLYEQCFRPDERVEFFGRHGEPTEEFYRNVNREFYGSPYYDDQPPTPPPGPAPNNSNNYNHDYTNNSNLRLLGGSNNHESPVNSRKQSRSTASTQSAHSSDESDDDMDCDEKWPPRARRSRSRSKSNDRKYRTNR